MESVIEALEDFCETIESTGGLKLVDNDLVPEADEEWIDLGDAYAKAYRALRSVGKPRPEQYDPDAIVSGY